jgi:hypothetical protein
MFNAKRLLLAIGAIGAFVYIVLPVVEFLSRV